MFEKAKEGNTAEESCAFEQSRDLYETDKNWLTVEDPTGPTVEEVGKDPYYLPDLLNKIAEFRSTNDKGVWKF